MIAAILVIIAFSLVIFIHELGHFLMALKVGIKVEIFSLGMGPKLLSFKKNGIEYRLSAVPIGGYVKMLGEDPSEPTTGGEEEFSAQPAGNRFKVLISGAALNYLLGLFLIWIVFMAGFPVVTAKIGGFQKGYPAEQSGIKIGDRVVAIDGQPVNDWDTLTEVMHKKKEGVVKVSVDRNGTRMEFTVKPVISRIKDLLGNEVTIAQIGIQRSDDRIYIKRGPLEALEAGARMQSKFVTDTFRALWNMIKGRLSFKENISGPVGIIGFMVEAAKIGILPLLLITSLISTIVGVFNILPIPPLDGGLILFIGIEELRGEPLSKKTQETLMQAGWVFFIALMLFATYGDILRKLGK